MQEGDRRNIRADGLVLERGRSVIKDGLQEHTKPSLTRKRPRSNTKSPSARISRKSPPHIHQNDNENEDAHLEEHSQNEQNVRTLLKTSNDSSAPNEPEVSRPREALVPISDPDRAESTSLQSTLPLVSETSFSPIAGGLRELQHLSKTANDLGAQQQKHFSTTERIQERLVKNEREYGEFLRQSLELQRCIDDRRKQIRIDKQELEKERAALKTTGDKLYQVVAAIQKISDDACQAEVKQEH